MRGIGMTEKQIGAKLDILPDTVTALECRYRQRAERRKHSVKLNGLLYDDFTRQAGRRGLPTEQLIETLLRTIVYDDLFAAILD